MDNSNIKVLDYFKLFKCSKSVFNTLDATYERACRESSIENYMIEMYDTITNYNEMNHTPLSNTNIREAIDKIFLEEQAKGKNTTVDMCRSQRN